MAKNCHHYVPRLYLRHFSSGKSGEDVINVYSIKSKLFRKDVGLKGQCSRRKFYGDTDELEDMLAVHENAVAPLLRRVVSQSKLPASSSDDMKILYGFVALQMLRTVGTVEMLSSGINQFYEHVEQNLAVHDRRIVPDDPRLVIRLLLAKWRDFATTISDMGAVLVINQTDTGFITSDNPVVKYNQYCEEAKGVGIVGTLRSGLQLFVPLSSTHVMLLYDKWVYKAGDPGCSSVSTTVIRDVESLNLLQAINAEEKLLFADWKGRPHIERIVKKSSRHRQRERTRLSEAVCEADDTLSLLHGYPCVPNVNLEISFMTIRRNARRLSIQERVNKYRDTNPDGKEANRKRGEVRGNPRLFRPGNRENK